MLEKLKSRKLILTTLGLLGYGLLYMTGNMEAEKAMEAAKGLIIAFLVAQGIVDAAGRFSKK